MRKLNKKGFLISEVLKIIISVICIVFLIYLGFKLLYPAKTDQDKARDQLENIQSLISQLNEGEDTNYILTTPKEWYFRGFNKENKPKFCQDKNCLCLCPKLDIESCDFLGACTIYNENLNMEIGISDSVFIDVAKNVYIKKSGNVVEIFSSKDQVSSSQIIKEYLDSQIEFTYKDESKKMSVSDFITYYESFDEPRPSKELLNDILLPKSLEILNQKIGNDKFAICFDRNPPGSENCWIYINQALWVRTNKGDNGNLLSEVNRPINVNDKIIYVKLRTFK
ncbi:hypothetical protein COU57_03755 [Candidatus Pacearchaeota archaeon CG10_big_fil_rev_8_21_14_0_10_32_14]|nr:MAG: hypothetical protein COU57_03755 [Candidatus Pacearchaeota archaeon CG10_big_fil_rev_8_21_14_0_10_32_14]